MEETILESLREIKKLVNLYITTIGFLGLTYMILELNTHQPGAQKPIEIFNLVIYPEYFSLIYGILFGVFIIVLFLKMYLLKNTIIRAKSCENADNINFVNTIKFFPSVVSPFHESKVRFIFWCVILGGVGYLLLLAGGHIAGDPSELPRMGTLWGMPIYNLIGYVDLLIFIVGIVFIRLISINVRSIKKEL